MSSNVIKRVISNPEQMGRDANAKISKTTYEENTSDIALSAMMQTQTYNHCEIERTGFEAEGGIIGYEVAVQTTNLAKKQNTEAAEEMKTSAMLVEDEGVLQEQHGSKHETQHNYLQDCSRNDECMKGNNGIIRSGNENNVISALVEATIQEVKATSEPTREGSESKNQMKSESRTSLGWGWYDDDQDALIMTDEKDRVNDGKKTKKNAKENINDSHDTDLELQKDDADIGTEVGVKMNGINVEGIDHDKKKEKKKGMFELFVNEPLGEEVKAVKTSKQAITMAVSPPNYVLEESPSLQLLWKNTAGTRPPQPLEERAFFESMWVQNFKKSHVKYDMPADVLTATSPISLSPFADNFPNLQDPHLNKGNANFCVSNEVEATRVVKSENGKLSPRRGQLRASPKRSLGPYDHHHTLVNKKVKDYETGEELTVLVKGDNVFGTTAIKSFLASENELGPVESVSISIASYRVVESKNHSKYAQFLVIFCAGTFRETLGVWKRYSDFDKLYLNVSHGHENCTSVLPFTVTEDPKEIMPNAITSWSLVKKRQRWYRCLDADYLSIKVFLLERFLHDILYESSSPDMLRDFVGVATN